MTQFLRRMLCAGMLALAAGQAFAADAAKPMRSGRAIYSVSCASCHSHGMRGAPQITDPSAWAPRLDRGMDTVYRHVIEGKGWMPRRGTCFSCSDDEVKAAVDYMLTQVK